MVEDPFALYRVADRFLIPQVKEFCDHCILDLLKESGSCIVIEALEVTHVYDLPELFQACIPVVEMHIKELEAHDDCIGLCFSTDGAITQKMASSQRTNWIKRKIIFKTNFSYGIFRSILISKKKVILLWIAKTKYYLSAIFRIIWSLVIVKIIKIRH